MLPLEGTLMKWVKKIFDTCARPTFEFELYVYIYMMYHTPQNGCSL